MVKKVNQASVKISKNERGQINSLVNILRPKVYITDSTSFKRLVQELTGNGSIFSSSPPTKLPQAIEEDPVVDIQDHQDPKSSTKESYDALIDLFESCDQISYTEELIQAYNEVCSDDNKISMNQKEDLSVYQDLESWLLDVDTCPYYSGYAEIEHMVNIYD